MDETVLLTGAGGRVGEAVLQGLSAEYDWKLLFHSPPDEEPDHEYLVGDVINDEDVAAAVEGVEAVIHLAGDPRPEAPWGSVLSTNIDGTQKMYEAAVAEGVEKFVYASSNHAVGAYETDGRI
ncbi:NAD(P)-dependent oxidoreductase, partial [Halobacteriales archaeon QH_8_68_33]